VLVVLCLLLSGCWDQHELQDRGVVLAVGIDVNDDPDNDTGLRRIESFTHSFGGNPYRLSLQVLKIGAAESGDKGQTGRGKTYTLSNTGISMFDMVRDMRGQTSKGLWFEHIQTIIISEAAVKKAGLSKLLDFFLRDGEMRWHARAYITPGKAQELMDFKPPTDEPGGIYLANIAKQHIKNVHIGGAKTDIGFTGATLDEGGDPILPRIEMVKDKVKINGLAMFKQDRFVGYVDEFTVKGIRFVRGNEKSALVPFECPTHPDDFVIFELFRHHTKLKPHVNGDSIWFTLDIAMRGNLAEVSCRTEHDTRDPEYIEKARVAFAKEVERTVAHSLQVCQTMGVDALYFSRMLQAYEPETWERIKDRWDEVFPTIPLYTSVNVTILHIGERR
jgi:Ger(x)C family germination protein